jgi:hypothetical protein
MKVTSVRRRWKFSLALAIVMVLGMSVMMAYTAYLRSSRQFILAVTDSEGNLYVLLESHIEGQRFRILEYSKEDDFGNAVEIDLEGIPGCGREDAVMVRNISGGNRSITVLGQCGWDGTDFKIWEYSAEDNMFSSPIEGKETGLDLAVSIQQGGVHGAAFTVAPAGARYCGRLVFDIGGRETQASFRDSLQESAVQTESCSAGIWSLMVDESDVLQFLVKERLAERFYLCSVEDSGASAVCAAIGDEAWDSCALNLGVEMVGCQNNSDSRYATYATSNLDEFVGECHVANLGEEIVPLEGAELAVIRAGGVEIEQC